MAKSYANLAKSSLPRLPRAIVRQALLRRLEALPARALWVHGAPGSGMTLLVSTLVERRGRPYLWYRVGPKDQEPARLFSGIAEAAAVVAACLSGRPDGRNHGLRFRLL